MDLYRDRRKKLWEQEKMLAIKHFLLFAQCLRFIQVASENSGLFRVWYREFVNGQFSREFTLGIITKGF